MMLQIVAYAVALTAILTVVGHCLERLAELNGLPRRSAWTGAMILSVLLPIGMILSSRTVVTAEDPVPAQSQVASPTARSTTATTAEQAPIWKLAAPTDDQVIAMWAIASSGFTLYLLGATLLLRLRAARWQRATVQGHEVLISEVTGPALMGVFAPRIVVPRWLLQESEATQTLILEHECQHKMAKDPLLMVAGLFIIAAVPWNPFLWWQWRRMRHAMEMDCDARVLKTGAEAVTYGEVLLAVTQRATRMFPGALAMSEPVAAMERRIDHLMPKEVRHVAVQTIGVFGLAAAGVGVALAMSAPSVPIHPSAGRDSNSVGTGESDMNKTTSIMVVGGALIAAATVQAQTPSDELRIKAETILARSDLNKDGQVTKDEATKANQPLNFMFDLYDRDRSGVVTATEIATFTDAVELGTAVEKIGGTAAAAGLPKKASPQLIIANNDQNGDGIVTKAEAETAKRALLGMWDQYDLDKDGKVDAVELAKASAY